MQIATKDLKKLKTLVAAVFAHMKTITTNID